MQSLAGILRRIFSVMERKRPFFLLKRIVSMSFRCLKIMEAPKRTLLVLERNSFSGFMVLVQFKHLTNTVTHASTVPYVDLQCHPHLSWSLCSQQVQQQDNTPCEHISHCAAESRRVGMARERNMMVP